MGDMCADYRAKKRGEPFFGEEKTIKRVRADLIESLTTQLATKTMMLDAAIAGQETLQGEIKRQDEKIARLTEECTESQRREKAAVEDSALRKSTELTPIYTCGGHGGYYDDDDEDFWCPICHAHLGTHRGFNTTCPRCGQRVNSDSEPPYNYRDMRKSEEEWRGQHEAGEESR